MNAKLDPRALAAANYIRAEKLFSEGPIIPWWLGPVLPPRSKRRGWRDYAALYVFCDIISAHRLKDGKVFFRGPLYQVNRQDWAEQIPTTLKEVSLTLTWPADDLGVIGRDQRVRLVDGKPQSSQTFAWPIGPRLQELIDYYLEHGRAMPIPYHEQASSDRDGLEGNLFSRGFVASVLGASDHDDLPALAPGDRDYSPRGPTRPRRQIAIITVSKASHQPWST